MSNFNWIKDLYRLEATLQPTLRARVIASTFSVSMGVYYLIAHHSWKPFLLASLIVFIVCSRSLSSKFFRVIYVFVFYVFQTVTLILLSLFYYLILTPYAKLYKLTGKYEPFNGAKDTSIKEMKHVIMDFERLF